MIHKNTFTKEWIQKKSVDYKKGRRKADPGLIEKVTKAIHLLEGLAETDFYWYKSIEIISMEHAEEMI